MFTTSSSTAYEHTEYPTNGDVPFKRIKLLGGGCYGQVDAVEGTSKPLKGKIYARKSIILPLREPAKGKMLTSIENEVKIVKEACHIHIVSLITTYICGKEFAMIMDPVAERDLGDYLENLDDTRFDEEGYLFREQLPQWFGCLVSGVHYLHSNGIRHRDIKPRNILILSGNVLLADFGISKSSPGESLSISTDTGGTPKYRAPEVVEFQRFGRKSDIFSLGAVFLEMITVHSGHKQLLRFKNLLGGRYADNIERVFQWLDHLGNGPRVVSWYWTMLYLCKKMLQVNKDQRPTSFALKKCWLYGPASGVPMTSCQCNSEESEDNPDGGMKDAIQSACKEGQLLLVDLLVERGADINDAFTAACEFGQKDVVELLIRKGADVNSKGALQQASAGGYEFLIQVLLKNGSNVNAKDSSECTALHMAAKFGHETVARILITNGADINVTDIFSWTALHRATTLGYENVAQLLIENGADVDVVDNNGWTALHRAAMNGQKIVAHLLIKYMADINAKDNHHRRTPLHLAAKSGNEEIVRMLLEKGADKDARDDDYGQTPLHFAVREGHVEVVQLLAQNKADIRIKDNQGKTALQLARHKSITRLLRENPQL